MPPLLVRLNLPGFSSPEPFCLAAAPQSLSGLHCAVLEEIGGFSREELQGVRENQDSVPLTLMGELCDGQLVELSTSSALEVFLATAESPEGPPTIEVRPKVLQNDGNEQDRGSIATRHGVAREPIQDAAVSQAPADLNESHAEETQQKLQQQLLEQQERIEKLQQQLQQEQSQAQQQQAMRTQITNSQSDDGIQTSAMPLQAVTPVPRPASARQQGPRTNGCGIDLPARSTVPRNATLSPTHSAPNLAGSPGNQTLSAADASPGGDANLACALVTPGTSLAPSPAGSQLTTPPTFTPQVPALCMQQRQAPQHQPTQQCQLPSPVQPVQSSVPGQHTGRYRTPDGHRKGFGQRAGQGATTRNSSAPWDNGNRGHNLRNAVGGSWNHDLANTTLESSQLDCDGTAGSASIDEGQPNARQPTGSARQNRDQVNSRGNISQAPVYIRLYQEKDDRRRRHEEARLRRLEQQEEDIRSAAQRALGRAPSPNRATSPEPFSGGRQSGAGTPPRPRPPLPGALGATCCSNVVRRSAGPGGGGGAIVGARPSTGGLPVPQKTSSRHSIGGLPSSAREDREARDEAQVSAAVTPSTAATVEVNGPPSQGSAGKNPADSFNGLDVSSAASESGMQLGLQSVPSMSMLGVEDSTCADQINPLNLSCEDTQSLKQLVQAQQQRIDFLETMHQQALRQLKRSREEVAMVQQHRFKEADKALQLEQLISEMQAARLDMEPQMQIRWQVWMQRSRAIFEAE